MKLREKKTLICNSLQIRIKVVSKGTTFLFAKLKIMAVATFKEMVDGLHTFSHTQKTIMKKVHIIGGGTFSYVRAHLALAAPAFGETAHRLGRMCVRKFEKMFVHTSFTRMADGRSRITTNEDIQKWIEDRKADLDTKVIFFNVAICDFNGEVGVAKNEIPVPSGKYAKRLKTSEGDKIMLLTPADKIVKTIREGRKDIFLVAFKTTCGATEHEQYLAGLNLLKKGSCNLVLANDIKTRMNMIITPEEAIYCKTTDREEILQELVDMTYLRSQLTFTRSTVVAGDPIPWDSEKVYPSLRTVVNYCINKNAYKPFNGATVGHFACKLDDNTFLTSIRKSNFNDLEKNGLVMVKTDGPDSVIAYGAKPSVGGQSQRKIFSDHPEYDCIVHFHCPLDPMNILDVPVISQKEYECGSHECGQNTSNGLKKFGNLSCVMLDNHGPNIVFHHSINPQEVIDFIEVSFDLSQKTSGPVN